MLIFKDNIKGFIYNCIDGSIVRIFNEELSEDKIKLINEIIDKDSILIDDEETLNELFEVNSKEQLLEDVELKDVVDFKELKLSEKVFEFECEVSREDFALEVKSEIDKLETLEDVRNYYLNDRGWLGNDSLMELLIDLIISLK